MNIWRVADGMVLILAVLVGVVCLIKGLPANAGACACAALGCALRLSRPRTS